MTPFSKMIGHFKRRSVPELTRLFDLLGGGSWTVSRCQFSFPCLTAKFIQVKAGMRLIVEQARLRISGAWLFRLERTSK
jgi:hypothetical protein